MLFFPGTPFLANLYAHRYVLGGAAASIGLSSCLFPFGFLQTAMYGACGAIQGYMGAFALSCFGIHSVSLVTAAAIGGLAAASIAAPFLIACGLSAFFPPVLDEDESFVAKFAINIAVMFFSSLIISLSFSLGAAPAVAVGVGATMWEIGKSLF